MYSIFNLYKPFVFSVYTGFYRSHNNPENNPENEKPPTEHHLKGVMRMLNSSVALTVTTSYYTVSHFTISSDIMAQTFKFYSNL